MNSAPVPKNTGFIPDFIHFSALSADLSAKPRHTLALNDLSAKRQPNGMNCAPVPKNTGFYP